jgi:hypothetical protein
MRKGLTTLMTVAIALLSVQAMAMAPVIGQIPSPIVGNKVMATQGQTQAYTYTDAFDLTTLAYDDNTASDQLKWTYEIIGTPKYSINGDAPINSVSGNVVNPPAAQQIQSQWNGIGNADAGDDPNTDTFAKTVTIRNIQLYPYGGSVSTDQSAAAQNWANNMQAVTFWCSDGSLATSSTVMFYTDNTYTNNAASGWNRLSNSSAWTVRKQDQLPNTSNWTEFDPFTGPDNHTTSNTWSDGRGLCLTVPAGGQNWGSMATPIGFVTLTDNMVYRIRLQMNCTQLTVGKTPFWDFILENWNGDGTKGQNFYGVDNMFIDNEGGANAIVSKQLGTEVTMIYAPAAFQTPQWRSTSTGIFAANAAAPAGNGINYSLVKDAALRFRVLDLDARSDLGNSSKSGSICMQNVIVETCPISRRVYEATGTSTPPTTNLYGVGQGINNLKRVHNNANDPVPGNLLSSAILGSTMSYAGGILSITPSTAGRDAEIVTVTPATNVDYVLGNWATIADDWPIAWESNKIYEMKVDMSAPDTTNEAHPWDVLWMNMESPTNEVIEESYITANHNVATPKYNNGTPQTYYLYYNSGKETNSSVSAYHFLRWRIRWANSLNCDWPNASNLNNTGTVRIHNIKVNKVRFE